MPRLIDFACICLTAGQTRMIRAILIPVFAIGLALCLFGLFIAAVGTDPLAVYSSIYRAAFILISKPRAMAG